MTIVFISPYLFMTDLLSLLLFWSYSAFGPLKVLPYPPSILHCSPVPVIPPTSGIFHLLFVPGWFLPEEGGLTQWKIAQVNFPCVSYHSNSSFCKRKFPLRGRVRSLCWGFKYTCSYSTWNPNSELAPADSEFMSVLFVVHQYRWFICDFLIFVFSLDFLEKNIQF